MKMILATLAGTVVSFLLGWLVFGMLMMDYYKNSAVNYPGLMKDEATFRIEGIFLANLVLAFFTAYVFDRWANIRTIPKGLFGGLFIGLCFSLTFDLFLWSQMNLYPYTVYIVDVLLNGAMGAVVGAVIAGVLGTGKKAA